MEIKDCVVLLAGLGTRCYPFSYTVPKCMIPVVNKPVIEYIVEELMLSGIENIYFVLPKYQNSKICLKHFKQNKKILKLLKQKNSPYYQKMIARKFPKIIPVYCKSPNGSGGALLECEKYLKNKTFAVVNSDEIFVGDIPAVKELIDCVKKINCCAVSYNITDISQAYKYGMIKTKQNKNEEILLKLIEKPKNNKKLTKFVVGRYILNYKIFDILKKTPKVNGEIYITTAIDKFAQDNKVICKYLSSKRYDCGCAEGIVKANVELISYKDKI